MNLRHVFNQLGLLLIVMSGVMVGLELMFLIVAAWQHVVTSAHAKMAMLATGGGGLLFGFALWAATRSSAKHVSKRDALLLVALSWLLGAGFAALPYWIWAHGPDVVSVDHPFRNFVDCYFEAMSGLTTTGATVLGAAPNDIESLPHSILLWRAFTQWLGGLGIVMLFVAVLPSLGVGGKKLYRIEAPGPTQDSVTPTIRETARVLWFIYLGLTLVQFGALMVAGLGWFDAVCHTFCSLATGGFSTKNASLGAFGPAVMIITIVFMVIAGTNFGLLREVVRGRWRVVLRDTEVRVYLILLLVGSTIVAMSLYLSPALIVPTEGLQEPSTFGRSALEGAFTTVSLQTGTGFTSSDFNVWPFAAQAVLIAFMFIGGCGGSTAGGIKVVRVWVVLKIMLVEIERVFHPNVVRPVRLGDSTVDDALRQTTLAYVLGMVVLFGIGLVAVALSEQRFNPGETCSFETAATASIATLCTVGPGLGAVGAMENYGWMASPTKVILSVLMVIGRLEVFAILVLFTPRFWRAD